MPISQSDFKQAIEDMTRAVYPQKDDAGDWDARLRLVAYKAAAQGRLATLQVLDAAGVDFAAPVGLPTLMRNNAVHAAAAAGQGGVIDFFAARGVPLDRPGDGDVTASFLARQFKHDALAARIDGMIAARQECAAEPSGIRAMQQAKPALG